MTKRIEALSRGLDVLNLLEAEGPLGLAELARLSGLPKPTLLRILGTLETRGYARRGLGDRLWRPASRRRPGTADDLSNRLAGIAGPVLDRLCQRVLWPSDVGIYQDGAIRVLETSRRLSPFLVNRGIMFHRVHVLPSAMGRALLAWADAASRERILATLAASDDAPDRVARDQETTKALLAATYAQGYATRQPGYTVSPPTTAQVTAIAVPVLLNGTPAAAINLSWVASAMSEADFVRSHLPPLHAAAREIAQAAA